MILPVGAEMSGGMRTLVVTQVQDLPPRPYATVDVADPMWKVVDEIDRKSVV